jgi:phage terminase small subunit
MLTPKQLRFVTEYTVDLNATQAAIRAGYSAKNADKIGSQLLGKTGVKEAIDTAMAEAADGAKVKRDRILREVSRLAFANILDYVKIGPDGQADVDLSKITRSQAAAISEISVDTTGGTGDGERRRVLRTRFKLADKRGPLELLGKYRRLWVDRFEVRDEVSKLSDEDIDRRLAELGYERKKGSSRD